jgi:hypothetical protein
MLTQLGAVGSLDDQSHQNPSIIRDLIMVEGTTIVVPLYVLLLHAPALYRAMLSPSPGTLLELKVVLPRLKNKPARSSRLPKAFAHQARDTPQPSHVPQLELALMVHVSSAAARPLNAAARRNPLCMVTGNFGQERQWLMDQIQASNCTSNSLSYTNSSLQKYGEAGSEPPCRSGQVRRLVNRRMQQRGLKNEWEASKRPLGSFLVGIDGTLRAKPP